MFPPFLSKASQYLEFLNLTMAAELETKEDFLFRAQLCEKVKRYDHMVKAMNKVAENFSKFLIKFIFSLQVIMFDPELDAKEREMWSTAYNGVRTDLHKAWRAMRSIHKRTSEDITDDQRQVVLPFKKNENNA